MQKNSLLISAKEASGVTNDKRTDLPSTNPSSKKFQLFSNKEKIDNKQKIENAEKKKKEEKIRAKAEKEAKKVGFFVRHSAFLLLFVILSGWEEWVLSELSIFCVK